MSIPIMLTQFGLLSMEEAVQLILDDWAREQLIQSDDIQSYDRFGYSVALTGDSSRLIVGAYLEDNTATNSGAAYVFTRSGNTWTQEQKLVASDAQFTSYFGIDVAISDDGDRVAVGAGYNDNTAGTDAGAVYVFSRSGTTWTQEQKLASDDLQAGDQFGWGLAMSEDGTRLAAGSNEEDTEGSNAGAAYVFSRSGTTWTQEQKLTASDAAAGDILGRTLAMTGDGDRVAIGAEQVGGGDAGAAYVFSRSGTTWTQEQKLTASDAGSNDLFGRDVTISKDGTRIAVGAIGESSNAGAAYVFSRSGTTWTEEQKLTHTGSEYMGSSVELSEDGTRLAVGASGADAADAGAAYVFSRSGTTWTEEQVLIENTDSYMAGTAISISDDGYRIAVAAPYTTGFVHMFETGLIDPNIIPEYIDSKSFIIGNSTQFDAAGDCTLTDMTFEAGDMIFINMTIWDRNGQVFTWSGDVDFTQIVLGGDPEIYHGYAILDGTETDIYLDPTTTSSTKLYVTAVNIAIFRNATYFTGYAGYSFGTSHDVRTVSSTSSSALGSVPAKSHELIVGCANNKGTSGLSSVTDDGTLIESQGYNGPGTADRSASMSYGIMDRHANPITITHNYSTDRWSSNQGYRFSATEPTNANITLVGTASTISSRGSGTVDVSGIDIQAGDYIFVAHSSASDIDSGFTWKTVTASTTRNMTTLLNSGGSSTMPHTAAGIIATGDEIEVRCDGTSTNWDYTSTVVAVFRSTDLSFQRTTVTSAANVTASDCVFNYTSEYLFKGRLYIATIHSDSGHGTTDDPITGPSEWTLAASEQNNNTYAKTAIFYRVDYDSTGFSGDTFGDSGGSRYWTGKLQEFI